MQATFAKKCEHFKGGGYGIEEKPNNVRIFHFHNPTQPTTECEGAPKSDDYCQGAVVVRIPFRTQNVWIVNTHIGLYDMQLNEVKQLITDFIPTLTDADADVVFVTGDFNSIPTSAAVMLMKKIWTLQ